MLIVQTKIKTYITTEKKALDITFLVNDIIHVLPTPSLVTCQQIQFLLSFNQQHNNHWL